jgi:hypothetical protein
MFGDAFAAKELPAFRTAGNRFPKGMIETALLGKILHYDTIPGGAFGALPLSLPAGGTGFITGGAPITAGC